jgi:hypothetical protein
LAADKDAKESDGILTKLTPYEAQRTIGNNLIRAKAISR